MVSARKKILVLGAGGMAGHVVAIRLKEKGYEVTGLARRKLPFCHSVILDVKDEERLRSLLSEEHFDHIVNAVGTLHATNYRPAYGIWTNAYFPHLLNEMLNDSDTSIIHISTDCVFNGHDGGNYEENSFHTASDYYGRSKSIGELNDKKNLTFRMSIVGPDINENGEGLFNWFMKQKKSVCGYAKAIWTGVTTITLADAIDEAIKQNITGIYHLVNNKAISKYELLLLFNNLRREKLLIEKSVDYIVDKSLINTRNDFRFVVPSYEKMIEQMGEWIIKHHKLYTYYDI